MCSNNNIKLLLLASTIQFSSHHRTNPVRPETGNQGKGADRGGRGAQKRHLH